MAVTAFFTRFKDLAFREMRTCTVPSGEEIPAGEYGFLEFYCDDAACDCRRVMIKVLGRQSGDKAWATISYGWEKPAFYRNWAGSDLMDVNELCRPMLDPLNPQSPHAGFFLALFKELVKDKAYVDRLKRHYEMFRKPAKRWGKSS
jgi:hypothetical protein